MLGFLEEQETRENSSINKKGRVYINCKLLFLTLVDQTSARDYNLFESKIPILCDNTTTIDLSKDTIMDSRAKHKTKTSFQKGSRQAFLLERLAYPQ